jgi:hypothetical protein
MEKDPAQPLRGTYTGVPQVAQDPMAQESMGPLYDRSQEHLGTSDGMMIKARRKLLNAVKAHRDAGAIPPGVDTPHLYRMRSGGAILPAGIDGMQALRPVHFFESDAPDLPLAVAVPAT